ncbi:nitroreductase family protein [Pseudalkalibacillus hwajinpoensis]|uniref:nitroreductase family protein n=1 Tax=Guptibacillus hwajinpoensis TaxID=208199 RepID=UPI001CD2AC0A|nr:nitroreductase family protein [Pseudalkalibacillus hwajinpoensis]MCA0992792.1 nitroreductase family protein [Pseudalkalibacillus hwajinpoensis]
MDRIFGSTKNETSTDKKGFYEDVKARRSIYGIGKERLISDEKLQEVIEYAVKHTPSAFNSQSARVLVLLDENHTKLWNEITKETLRAIVPADQFEATEGRMNGFAGGYGTVLFFEDQDVIKGLQEKLPTFADNFPKWSQHSSGMLQFVIWTALEKEGLGASLQHYNPLIDDQVKEEWDVPSNWELIAQMPFGNPTAPPGGKEFQPVEERVIFHK